VSNVLGLSFHFHDSAAALVQDGQIIAAAAEERFTRRKHTDEFPKQAIEYCLEQANLKSINDLDAIVFYEKPILKLQRVLENLVAVWPRGLQIFARSLPQFLVNKFNVQREIEETLPAFTGEILFSEHHASHAASAFYCSPFDEAAILTIDGVGEWETTAIGRGEGRSIVLDRSIHFPHSVGLLYSALTSYLGFRVNDGEWKVMGLAPYGEPKYVEQFRKLVRLKPDGSFRLEMDYFVHHYSSRFTAHPARWHALFGFPMRNPDAEIEQVHEDLACSGQVVVEEIILGLAREARKASGSANLVIAGGVGLNSVANWKIEAEGIFENVWIQPAAGDDGGALGAALLVSQELFRDPPCAEMTHAFYGPEIPQEEIDAFLESRGIQHERLDEETLPSRTADLIVNGQVVGWFQGRMEFGPRALGSRSILADATNPEMKGVINGKIKYREYFRPFAPAVPLENVHEYFDVEPGTNLPFMLKVPQVLPEQQARIPAVTHEDRTGRVQTVTLKDNGRYYRVIKAVGERTGVPVIINTSFNVRGEPIVHTAEDAYRCFLSTGIDALVLGTCLITTKPESDIDHDAGYERSNELEAALGAKRPAATKPGADGILWSTRKGGSHADTQQNVLDFYRELPFNFYSNAVDTAKQLLRSNRVKDAYPTLHQHLAGRKQTTMIDVGCGAGWFVNSSAQFYDTQVRGIDLNKLVLKQARSVARLMDNRNAEFTDANVFEYEPGTTFDVVNSLGVLHHTPDCHGAIRRVLKWVAPGGHLHLGLYHSYGRHPFLVHFKEMQKGGATEQELLDEFAELNPEITDETHMRSWFRDQVLHPHETQHSYEEIEALLREEGFRVERTSINSFGPMPSLEKLIALEKKLAETSKVALTRTRKYFPGFFVVWAKRAEE